MKLDQQVAAVVREIGMRKAVYPGRVEAKKMSKEKADHEVQAMEAVLVTVRDYQAMQPKVLALMSVITTLADRLGLPKEDLDVMLEFAETHASVEMAQAKAAAADPKTPPPWPFPRGQMS